MTVCFEPKNVWWSRQVFKSGKRGVVFLQEQAMPGTDMFQVDCRKCDGCRAKRAQQLSTLCWLEAQRHKLSCFVTLTYDNAIGGPVRFVSHRDIELFVRRLRKYCKQRGITIKYVIAAEYGEHTDRPHYHALIYGYDFREQRYTGHGDLPSGMYASLGADEYLSSDMQRLWGHGNTRLAPINPNRCGYVAQYCFKKLGDQRGFICKSKGLGDSWIDAFCDDVRRLGYIPNGNAKLPIPPRLLKRKEEELAALKQQRIDYLASLTPGDIVERERKANSRKVNFRARLAIFRKDTV